LTWGVSWPTPIQIVQDVFITELVIEDVRYLFFFESLLQSIESLCFDISLDRDCTENEQMILILILSVELLRPVNRRQNRKSLERRDENLDCQLIIKLFVLDYQDLW
jgi:hypothetical protein